METLRRETEGVEIGLLVCNAAQPLVGLFFEQSLEDKVRTVEVNCRARWCWCMSMEGRCWPAGAAESSCFRRIRPAGRGLYASYAASKAYNLILAESLWEELRERGVDVLGFMPGATRTPGFEQSKPRLERSTLAGVSERGLPWRRP